MGHKIRSPQGRKGQKDYRKPQFGRMHTEPSVNLHTPERAFWVIREGLGDFRGKYGDYGELIYRPFRNGLPPDKPYVYRAPGWEDRLRKAGLDPEAIRQADLEMHPKPWLTRSGRKTWKTTAPRRAGNAGPRPVQPQPTMREIPAQVARRLARGRGGGGSAR